MRIKRILIEFEGADNEFSSSHARTANFEDGKWTFDGPVYSRLVDACHKIWQLLRTDVVKRDG